MTALNSHNTSAQQDFSSAQIEAALINFLEALSNQNSSKATIRNYRSDIKQFYKFSLLEEIKDLFSKDVLKEFVIFQKEKGLKDSSVTRKIVSITQFALWAKQQGIISNDVSWMPKATIESLLKSGPIHIPNPPAPHKQPQPDFTKKEITQPKINKSPAFLKIFSRKKTQTNIKEAPLKEEKTNNKSIIGKFSPAKNAKKKKLPQTASNFILPYLNLGLIILFFIGLGFLGYNQLVTQTPTSLAFPSNPVVASRVLSFQGRLTDTAQNPITTPTNMEFKIWSVLSGGTEGTCDGTNDCEYKTATCSITPDQDGIFNVGIGDDCGSEIGEGVFTENLALWLEVIVATETLTPRQPIRTVPFAINSETVQGFPISASESATVNTILVMDEGGYVRLAENNPKLVSESGTFTIGGVNLSLEATNDIFFSDARVTDIPLSVSDTALDPALGQGIIDAINDVYNLSSGSLFFSQTSSVIYPAEYWNDELAIGGNSTASANIWLGATGGAVFNEQSNDVDFRIEGNGNANLFFVDASADRIGIGDSTPDHFLDVAGNIGLDASGYINWGDVDGTTGYGFRDSAGTIQFKHDGGSWTDVGTSTGGGDSLWQITTGALTPSSGWATTNFGNSATASAKVSISGSLDRGQAAIIVNQTEAQDIFTASASGVTKLTINNNGNISLANGEYISNATDDLLVFGGAGGASNTDFTIDLDGNNPVLYSTSGLGVEINDRLYIGANGRYFYDEIGHLAFSDNLDVDGSFAVGNVSATGNIGELITSSNMIIGNQGDLRLREDSGSGSNYTGFQAPTTLGGDIVYTLPNADGSGGEVLTTDGLGILSWTSPITDSPSLGAWTHADHYLYSDEYWADDIVIGGNSTASADIWFGATGGAIFNEQGNDVDFRIEGIGQANALFVQGSDGNVGIGTGTPNQELEVNGDILLTNIGNQLLLSDDGYLKSYQNNGIELQSAGILNFKIADRSPFNIQYTDIYADANFTVNEFGGNYDFRAEGATNTHLLFTDASADRVGIGDSTPDHFFDVAGNIGLDASGYINWGDVDGTAGYGFRDSAGTLQYKNSAGNWTDIGLANTFWQLNDGALTPIQTGYEINLGNIATDSAKISLAGSETRGKATVIINQTESQDIIAASSSGITRFKVDNDGYVYSQRFVDFANSNYYFDGAATGTSLAVAGKIVSDGGAFESKVADGASAVAYTFNTTNVLSTEGALIADFQNNGTSLVTIDKDGNTTVSGSLDVASSASPADLTVTGDIILGGQTETTSDIGTIYDSFAYDTTIDSDSGRWINNAVSKASSWYTETLDAEAGAECSIGGTDDRCEQAAFPDKAIIIGTSTEVIILDEISNNLWMRFTVGDGKTIEGTITRIYAKNGQVFISTNGTGDTGLTIIDFAKDKITRYDSAGRNTSNQNIAGRNGTHVFATDTNHHFTIDNDTVNDFDIATLEGKTYYALATDGGAYTFNPAASASAEAVYDRATGGTASASNFHASYPPSAAFDNDFTGTANGWYADAPNTPPQWIQYDLGSGQAKIIESYSITSYNNVSRELDPSAWTLYASNTGSFAGEEVTLDSKSSQAFTQNQTRTFDFTNNIPYRYYRINVTAIVGVTYPLIQEIQLFEKTNVNRYYVNDQDDDINNIRLTSSKDMILTNESTKELHVFTNINDDATDQSSPEQSLGSNSNPGVLAHPNATKYALEIIDNEIYYGSGAGIDIFKINAADDNTLERAGIYNSGSDYTLSYDNAYNLNSTTALTDLSGNEADSSSVNGTPTLITDAHGTASDALDFENASTQYFVIPDANTPDIGSEFSMGFWMKHDGADIRDYQAMMGTYAGAGNGWSLGLTGPDNSLWFYDDGAYGSFNNAHTIPADTWTHVAITFTDGGEELSLFINGVLVEQNVAISLPTDGTELRIGCWGTGLCDSTYAYDGGLDDVFIIAGRAISEAEVSSIMIDGFEATTTRSSSLIGDFDLFYDFSDATASATHLFDQSGNKSHTNILSGAPTAIAGPGEDGTSLGALDFDNATNDYYIVPDSRVPDLGDYFSMGAWIKSDSGDTYTLRGIMGTYLAATNGWEFVEYEEKLQFYDDGAWCDSGYVIEDDVWSHVAVTFADGSDEMTFYVNGEVVAENVACSNPTDGTDLYIGSHGANAPTTYDWDGGLDDVFIVNDKALSQKEIQSLYARGLPGLHNSVENATVYSSSTIGDSSLSWEINEHVGEMVEITGGTGVGQYRIIKSNSATTITTTSNWSVTPDATSDFRILKNAYPGVAEPKAIHSDGTNMYFGDNDGADGGGVFKFTLENDYSFIGQQFYNNLSGITDDSNNAWASTYDDITSIQTFSDNKLFITSDVHYWKEYEDESLLSKIDRVETNTQRINNLDDYSLKAVNSSGTLQKNQVIRSGSYTLPYTSASVGANVVCVVSSSTTINFGINFEGTPNVVASPGLYVSNPYGEPVDYFASYLSSVGTSYFTYFRYYTGPYNFSSARSCQLNAVPIEWIAIGTYSEPIGADIAEHYQTYDLETEAGDVVSIDPDNDISVTRSNGEWDKNAIGIVATHPGITLGSADGTTAGVETSIDGSAVESGKAKTVQVALVGRVPVKVSLENGPIKKGDYLAPASKKGYAMRATEPGLTVGRALEDFDGSSTVLDIIAPEVSFTQDELQAYLDKTITEASASGAVSTANPDKLVFTEGKVMAFVQTGYYQGQSISAADFANYEAADGDITQEGKSNSIIASIPNFTQDILARIKKATENTRVLLAERAQIFTSIFSKEVLTEELRTDFISPLGENKDLTIQLGSIPTATDSADYNSKLRITNASGSAVTSIDERGNITTLGDLIAADASLSGTLTVTDASISGTLYAKQATISGQLDTTSARIRKLETKLAQIEAIEAQTAQIVNATISGTLYADNIDDFENKVAEAIKQPSLLEKLINKQPTNVVETVDSYFTNSKDIADLDTSSISRLKLEDLELTDDDLVIDASALFINKYLDINGSAYIAKNLGLGQSLVISDAMYVTAGSIDYAPLNDDNPILNIQPSGKGILSLMAGIFTLDEFGEAQITGNLTVNGNLRVSETLLTNIITANDFTNPLQVQLATMSAQVLGENTEASVQESRFEILNELGIPVATISAQGKAAFSSGIGVGSEILEATDSAQIESEKTSGTAIIREGSSEIVIKSPIVTTKSLIYITPLGSTNNKVLYIKEITNDDLETPQTESGFTVGFDSNIDSDVRFNWWIVN